MRVLLTGPSGLIGSQLGISLVRAGHQVVTLSRSPRPDLPYPNENHVWSDTSKAPPTAAVKDIDVVVHLAGESIAEKRWTPRQKQVIESSRVDSTRNLARAFKQSPAVWINASAVGYYGSWRGDELLEEDSPKGEGFLGEVCDRWEQALTNEVENARKVFLRFGVVLSRRGGFLSKILPLFRLGLGGRVAGGKQWISWLHLDDAVKLIVTAIDDPRYVGIYNAVSPDPVTNADFTKALANVLKRPAFAHAPAAAVKLAMGEMSELALGGQRVSSRKLEKLDFQFNFPDLKSALKNICDFDARLGVDELYAQQWVPTPLKDIFPFFSDETNLEKITPPWLGFHVQNKSTKTIQEGTLINYKLRIRGVPAVWQSRIEEWRPPHSFVDTQLKGPYGLWHHTHAFEALGGGTLMTDRVLYKLPVWPLGILSKPLVASDVKKIFAYRRKTINEMFAKTKPAK